VRLNDLDELDELELLELELDAPGRPAGRNVTCSPTVTAERATFLPPSR